VPFRLLSPSFREFHKYDFFNAAISTDALGGLQPRASGPSCLFKVRFDFKSDFFCHSLVYLLHSLMYLLSVTLFFLANISWTTSKKTIKSYRIPLNIKRYQRRGSIRASLSPCYTMSTTPSLCLLLISSLLLLPGTQTFIAIIALASLVRTCSCSCLLLIVRMYAIIMCARSWRNLS